MIEESSALELKLQCDYCKAKLKVLFIKQKDHNEKVEFKCPECDKSYIIRAALPIWKENIVLIASRTDGRIVKYKA